MKMGNNSKTKPVEKKNNNNNNKNDNYNSNNNDLKKKIGKETTVDLNKKLVSFITRLKNTSTTRQTVWNNGREKSQKN